MTADGRGRERGRPSGLSRRRLLAGLGSIGAVSAASGAGTFAYLSDEEALRRNEAGAGTVDLDVSCASRGARCAAADGRVTVTPENPLDRGDSGEAVVTVGVRTNPVRLWFATTCPPAEDPLGDALEVSLRVDGDRLFDGSLSALRREFSEFSGGVRIDDSDEPCLDPDGDPVEIEFGWTLPDDAPATDGSTRTGFEFRLYAEQCRHVSEAEATNSNPFAGADPCDEPDDHGGFTEESDCVVCADQKGTETPKIGSLTLRYLGTEPTGVTVVAQGGRSAKNGRQIFASSAIAPGQSFTVSSIVDGDRLARNLYVDDGSETGSDGSGKKSVSRDGTTIHTSCSEPLEPGMVFGRFELVSGTTIDDKRICGPAAVSDDVNAESGGEDGPTEAEPDENGEPDEGPDENGEPDEGPDKNDEPDGEPDEGLDKNDEPDEGPDKNDEPDGEPDENDEDDRPARSENPNDPDSRAQPGGQNRNQPPEEDRR